jgi:hypothetical protein
MLAMHAEARQILTQEKRRTNIYRWSLKTKDDRGRREKEKKQIDN